MLQLCTINAVKELYIITAIIILTGHDMDKYIAFHNNTGQIRLIYYSNDATLITVTADGTIRKWNVMDAVLQSEEKKKMNILYAQCDSRYLYCHSTEGILFLFDKHTLANIRMIRLPDSIQHIKYISEDANMIVTTTGIAGIILYSSPNYNSAIIKANTHVNPISVFIVNKSFFFDKSYMKGVFIGDIESKKYSEIMRYRGKPVTCISPISNCNDLIFIGFADGKITIYNYVSDTEIYSGSYSGSSVLTACGSDGVISFAYNDGTLCVYDYLKKKVLFNKSINAGISAKGMIMSPNRQSVVLWNWDVNHMDERGKSNAILLKFKNTP